MHLYSRRCNCFSLGRHPPAASRLCNKSCEVLAEGGEAITRGQGSQRPPPGYRTVQRSAEVGGGQRPPPPHWHHRDAECSHVTSQIPRPVKMRGFTGNTLHYWKGGVKSTSLPQGCTQVLRAEAFPLGKTKGEVLPLCWPLRLPKLQERLNKQIYGDVLVLHEILNLCKPVFKKNKDSLVKASECVFIYKLQNPPKGQASICQKKERQTEGKNPDPIFKINFLGSE